jgi:putative protease
MPDVHVPSRDTIELLAPAGDRDALAAAVRGGADAVYLGLQEFNARRGAENFTLESLQEVCDFAHLRGVSVYLTVNVALLPDETDRALSMVDRAWAAGVDAVIVQDLGLMRLVSRLLPDVRIHASTQVGTHNLETARALEELGCARVTLARELTLGEIRLLCAEAATEVEVFVHGALCVCYSGQCLLASMVGGRSANRGQCSQPCRMPYDVIDARGEPVRASGPYLLSPADLALASRLPELLDAGVTALKIEGRMKSPEYVALVTGVYRRAIDRALCDPDDFEVTDGEWSVLEEAFSRGFTDAYLDGLADDRLMSTQRPSDRGVLIGRVRRSGSGLVVRLDRALEVGDRVEFWTGRGRTNVRVDELEVEGRQVGTAPAGADVVLPIPGGVAAGDRVFRVESASLMEAARRVYVGQRDERETDVRFEVDVVTGEPLRIRAISGGATASAEGSVVEEARTKRITTEEIVEHVDRLGGTRYRAAGWDVRLSPDAGLGYSELHRARREALERLDEHLLAGYRSRSRRDPVARAPQPLDVRRRTTLVAVVLSEAHAREARGAGADEVLLAVDPEEEPRELAEGVLPLLPRIARRGEVSWQMAWLHECGGGVGDDIGIVRRAGRDGIGVQVDIGANLTNPFALAAVSEFGADRAWLSPELTVEQILTVASRAVLPVGVVVAGRHTLMVTEHCVLSSMGDCSHRCAECDRHLRPWYLQDRKGYRFPIRVDSAGRTRLWNALPLDATGALPPLVQGGVSSVRIDLTDPLTGDVGNRVGTVRGRLDAAIAGRSTEERPSEDATSGHFFRGVT